MNDKWYTNREVIALLRAPKGKYGKVARLWINALNVRPNKVLYTGQDIYQKYVHAKYKGSWITKVRFPPLTIDPELARTMTIGSMVKEQLKWQIDFGEDDPDE